MKSEIFSKLKKHDKRLFYLNTLSQLDLATGAFLQGSSSLNKKDIQFYLNGGVSPTFSIVGREQTFKSSTTLSYLSRILSIYKDSYGLVYDTEFAISDENRIISLGNELSKVLSNLEGSSFHGNTISERIVLKDKSEFDLDGFFNIIKEIAEERIKHEKDYEVESPFINPNTNKPYRTWIPFIVVIDSLTLMQSISELELYDKHQITDKETNMIFMSDGKSKTQFIRQLPLISNKAGIYFMITAHVGKKMNLNPFEKVTRDLQFMNMNDTIKGVGSQFTFLINTLIESREPKVLLDSNKKCLYPRSQHNSPVELSLLKNVVCRCKNNISGQEIPIIISQDEGLLSGLSYFHYIKEGSSQNMFGLDGNNRNQKVILKDDISINRKNIREHLSQNYELFRAIEITAQLLHILSWWNVSKIPELLSIISKTANDIFKGIVGNKSIKISDILNSRSYWTYDKKDKRTYMSIFDIIKLINK